MAMLRPDEGTGESKLPCLNSQTNLELSFHYLTVWTEGADLIPNLLPKYRLLEKKNHVLISVRL